MAWTNLTKKDTRFLQTRGTAKTPRGTGSRGNIAKTIRGSATAEVTRRELEDYFGTRGENNFTETDKNTANWSE